jgi:hypothetical protein
VHPRTRFRTKIKARGRIIGSCVKRSWNCCIAMHRGTRCPLRILVAKTHAKGRKRTPQ